MNRASSAIAGGIAGTAVMSLMLIMLEVQTRSVIGIFSVIARFVRTPNDLTLGFLVFVAVGCFAWPLLFVALEPYLPGWSDPATRGAVFATLLWIAFVITGRGDIGGPLLVIYAAYTLFAHWAYGFTLGTVYNRLSTRRVPSKPEGV